MRTVACLLLCLTGLSAPQAEESSPFPPFFDEDPSTRHAPEDPPLTDFDLEVLELCGDWGGEVKAVDFEAMMLSSGGLPTLRAIRKAMGGRLYTATGDKEQFVRELRRVWFEQKGFKHIFCGEPESGYGLGGLHYAPRYWQAQERGWAGYHRLDPQLKRRSREACKRPYLKERIRPPLFAVGVEFRYPESARTGVKCLSGYHREMDAERIMIAATLAWKQARKRVDRGAKEACLFETHPPGVERHFSRFVIKYGAIRTFYPDAERRPYCKKNRRDIKACYCSNLGR